MKKYAMPKIAPEDMIPEIVELVAYVESLVAEANALHEEGVALRQEIARVQAEKRATGSRK